MFKLLSLIIFIVFMLSCSDLDIKNISCENGNQCPINAICLEGHCVLESDDVSCKNDINCKNGEICNEGKCKTGNSSECTTSEQRCKGGNVETCNSGGEWAISENCIEPTICNESSFTCETPSSSCDKDCHGHGNCEINNNNGSTTQICECTDPNYIGDNCNTCAVGYHKENANNLHSNCVKDTTCTDSNACQQDEDGKIWCNNGDCVECLKNAHCSGDTPYCSPINNICVNKNDICEGVYCTSEGDAPTNTNLAHGVCALSDTDGPSLPECFCSAGYFAKIGFAGTHKCLKDNDSNCPEDCGDNGACKLTVTGTDSNYQCICKEGYTILDHKCRKLGIFVTENKWSGDLGGIVGADAKCNDTSDTGNPNDNRYYKALLGLDSVRNEPSTDWPLLANFSYYRANDKTIKIGTTSSEATFDVEASKLDNPISSSESEYSYTVWTGLDVNGKVDAGNCNSWSSENNSDSAFTASSNSGGKEAMYSISSHCNGMHHLYCVEQVCKEGYTYDSASDECSSK